MWKNDRSIGYSDDHNQIIDTLNDFQLIRSKYATEVIIFDDLLEKHNQCQQSQQPVQLQQSEHHQHSQLLLLRQFRNANLRAHFHPSLHLRANTSSSSPTYTKYSYNELKLMLTANCKNFIGVQGGNNYLASYFLDKLAVYHVEGDGKNAYNGWISNMHGGTDRGTVKVSDRYDQLIEHVKELFL